MNFNTSTGTQLSSVLASITEYWTPVIIAELNGQHVKLAKLLGAFVWHHHSDADELFYVLQGTLTIHLRGGSVRLQPGDCYVIPRGVEHMPECTEEVHVMLFETVGTINTGNVVEARTVVSPENRAGSVI